MIESQTYRQSQAIARQQQILETAIQLFAKNGFDGTSTKEIAHQAGISEGLIFHYFPTKADLLTAVLETRHGFLEDLKELLDGAGDRPASDLLPALAVAWFTKLYEEKNIISVLFGMAQIDSKVGGALKRTINEGVELLSAYLRERIRYGELRADLPVETGALMFFASPMIFFVANRDLKRDAWQKQAVTFSREMLSVWMDGAMSK
ncbi:MAG: TetR/AcrR family transcriptional regulator [Anaerolineales bacterium]|nr:TetR/AcrR family transcriptional regulator [Anaerolineales bacterium]